MVYFPFCALQVMLNPTCSKLTSLDVTWNISIGMCKQPYLYVYIFFNIPAEPYEGEQIATRTPDWFVPCACRPQLSSFTAGRWINDEPPGTPAPSWCGSHRTCAGLRRPRRKKWHHECFMHRPQHNNRNATPCAVEYEVGRICFN